MTSTQLNLNLSEARVNRDAGIQKAIDSAERKNPGWSAKAWEMFRDWLKGWPAGYKFTIEEFRQIANIRGLEEPPSNRAFGRLAVKAKCEGLIKSNGTVKVKNKKAHCANAALWIKL